MEKNMDAGFAKMDTGLAKMNMSIDAMFAEMKDLDTLEQQWELLVIITIITVVFAVSILAFYFHVTAVLTSVF